MNASDIPFSTKQQATTERIFRERGDQRYSLDVSPAGIEISVDRLRREHRELVGELSVKVNGGFPNAKTINGGVLSIGDLNFSSVQARGTRAKLLAERSGSGIDWVGLLDEFVLSVIAAERAGKPAVILADKEYIPEDAETWDVTGIPILKKLPMVIFGDGGSGKSYMSMWIAGSLALQDIPVLYADWEFDEDEHNKRLGWLFQPKPRLVHYVRCEKPIKDEIERLVRLIQTHRIQYVICDSMVFALEGPAEGSEQAGIYFRAIRQLKVGSLSLAHTTKADDDSEKKVYGSIFFSNGARSVWFVQRATENPQGKLRIGMYHRKSNVGDLLKPRGFELAFGKDCTRIEKISIESVDELAAKLPLLERMKKGLAKGAVTPKQLAADLGTTVQAIQSILAKHASVFVHLGPKVGLSSSELEF